VEARMGMALGTWKNGAMGRKKPWSRTKSEQKVWNRRPSSQRFREMEEDDEENNLIHSDDNGKKPCVGMCYYQKVLALKTKLERQKAANEVIEKPISQIEDTNPSKPCVGLCQYYKSLGKNYPNEN